MPRGIVLLSAVNTLLLWSRHDGLQGASASISFGTYPTCLSEAACLQRVHLCKRELDRKMSLKLTMVWPPPLRHVNMPCRAAVGSMMTRSGKRLPIQSANAQNPGLSLLKRACCPVPNRCTSRWAFEISTPPLSDAVHRLPANGWYRSFSSMSYACHAGQMLLRNRLSVSGSGLIRRRWCPL
jgi:hypothetical protein